MSLGSLTDLDVFVSVIDLFYNKPWNGNKNWNMTDLNTETETEKIFKTEIQ